MRPWHVGPNGDPAWLEGSYVFTPGGVTEVSARDRAILLGDDPRLAGRRFE